ncbi:MAG: LLM class flavin-dependent oxidoreductase [Acidisphaera sp.]|nr:LLM class flavin-dependent oxidoreductase [Acidisphaera sp.]
MDLDLGVLLFSDYPTRELVELGSLCEAAGYRYFWYTDVRFARDCYIGLTAVAGVTRTMLLGPGVTDPYSRHPALTATAVATLDELSGGRALLGLGTGGSGFRELGIDPKLPVAALRETVAVIRGLLRGEPVSLNGKVVTIDGGRLAFTPANAGIPVYFATHGAQVTRLAGEVADGVLIANTLSRSAFEQYLRRLDEGLARRTDESPDFDIGLRVEAAIAEDDAAAFAVMRRRVATRVLSQYPHWDYLGQLGIVLPEEFVSLAAAHGTKAAKAAAPLLPAEVVQSMALAGDPERVAAQLARALHPRVTQLTVRPHAVKGQNVAEVIRSFAEEVVPRALQMREAHQAT